MRTRNSAIESRFGITLASLLKSSSTGLTVHRETIGRLTLSADRYVPRIEIARGWSARAARHNHSVGLRRTRWNYSRLKCQKIGETAAIQWHSAIFFCDIDSPMCVLTVSIAGESAFITTLSAWDSTCRGTSMCDTAAGPTLRLSFRNGLNPGAAITNR